MPKRPSRIHALKGKERVGLANSAENKLTTAVLCMSASGYYLPSQLIFPRMRMKVELLDDAPPNTIAVIIKAQENRVIMTFPHTVPIGSNHWTSV